MRGRIEPQIPLFVTFSVEERVPAGHPLRATKRFCDGVLEQMRTDFNRAYSRIGRPGIPPEQLLKALLLQALYSIKSEIKLMEAIEFNLLFRWFVDLPMEEQAWTPESFSMNRQRFQEHDLFRKFFDRVVAEGIEGGLVSSDHFTVDGTLIRSWASLKSLTPKDSNALGPQRNDDDPGNPTVDFHNQKRGNATHQSGTDPEARLARKGPGKEAHLCHSGHFLMENRNGLLLDIRVDAADGQAERRMAERMLKHLKRKHNLAPSTVGADTGYDDGKFLRKLEKRGITPHIPVRSGPIKAQDAAGAARRRARRRMKQASYGISQRIRKRVEEIIGWCKSTANLARARMVKRWKIGQEALVTGAAYNLLRITRLQVAAA